MTHAHTIAALAPGSAAKAAGFTLVELMVVLVIVGLMGTVVVMTAPGSDGLARDADTLAARLMHARDEAILGTRAVQVTVDATGYRFARQSFSQWQPLDDRPFQPVRWKEGIRPLLGQDRERVVFHFDPAGGSRATEAILSRDGRQLRVMVDVAGEVTVDATH